MRCTILSYNDDALLRDCDARADARGWVLARAEPRRQGRVHHHQLEQHQVTLTRAHNEPSRRFHTYGEGPYTILALLQ